MELTLSRGTSDISKEVMDIISKRTDMNLSLSSTDYLAIFSHFAITNHHDSFMII